MALALVSVADLLTDNIFLEKILSNYPQPSDDIDQWLRDNYKNSLAEALEAKAILEGLDEEAPMMTPQEQREVKEDIAYSLKLHDFNGR